MRLQVIKFDSSVKQQGFLSDIKESLPIILKSIIKTPLGEERVEVFKECLVINRPSDFGYAIILDSTLSKFIDNELGVYRFTRHMEGLSTSAPLTNLVKTIERLDPKSSLEMFLTMSAETNQLVIYLI